MSDLDWNTLGDEISARMDLSEASDAMAHVDLEARVFRSGRSRGDEVVGDPRLANPFEDFDEVYPVDEGRTIPVTDEMRAADAAKQAARELQPEHPWAAVKASLSNDNLRTTKRKPATALRQADEQRIVLPRVVKPGRGRQTRSDEPLRHRTPKRDKPAASGVTIHVHGDLKSMPPATREAIGELATAAVAHHKTLSGRVPPIPPHQETTMSKEVLCKGGCGRPVAPSNVAKGFLYYYGCRKTGCAPMTKRGRPAGNASKPAKKSAANKPSKDASKPAPIVLTALAPASAHETMLMLPVSEATLDRYLRSLRPEAKVAVVSALLRDLPEGDARA